MKNIYIIETYDLVNQNHTENLNRNGNLYVESNLTCVGSKHGVLIHGQNVSAEPSQENLVLIRNPQS